MLFRSLTPNERRVAEDRQDCYWLYVVTGCKTQSTLQEPIKNPARFPWHEVKKVDHYYLSVDALTQPMEVGNGPSLTNAQELTDSNPMLIRVVERTL